MHKSLSDAYLHPEIIEQIEHACKKLDVNKSLFLNVLLKELFSKANPEDLFYNRVTVTNLVTKASDTIIKSGEISH